MARADLRGREAARRDEALAKHALVAADAGGAVLAAVQEGAHQLRPRPVRHHLRRARFVGLWTVLSTDASRDEHQRDS